MKKTTFALMAAALLVTGTGVVTTLADEVTTSTTSQTRGEKQAKTLPDFAALLQIETIDFATASQIATDSQSGTLVNYSFRLTNKETDQPAYTFSFQTETGRTRVSVNAVDGTIISTDTKEFSTDATITTPTTVTISLDAAQSSLDAAQSTAQAQASEASLVGYRLDTRSDAAVYIFDFFDGTTTSKIAIDATTGEVTDVPTKSKGGRGFKGERTEITPTTETQTNETTASATPTAQ